MWKDIIYSFLFILFVTQSAVASADNVIVVTENYPPYNYKQNDQLLGLSTDVIRKVMDASGLEYEIRLYPWARAYTMALTQDNVLIYTIMRTKERESLFHWIVFLGKSEFYLMGRSDKNYESSIPELITKKYKAVCVINDASCEWLREAGFPNDLIHEVPDNIESSEIKMILNGRVDFFVADPVYLNYRLQQIGIPEKRFKKISKIHEGRYYLAAGKQLKQNVLERIQEARDSLNAGGLQMIILHK